MKVKPVACGKEQHKPLWPSLADGPIAVDKTRRQPQAADDVTIYWANRGACLSNLDPTRNSTQPERKIP